MPVGETPFEDLGVFKPVGNSASTWTSHLLKLSFVDLLQK